MTKNRQRKLMTVSVDPKSVRFIDDLIRAGVYRSRSDAIDRCMDLARDEHKRMKRKYWWYRMAVKKKI